MFRWHIYAKVSVPSFLANNAVSHSFLHSVDLDQTVQRSSLIESFHPEVSFSKTILLKLKDDKSNILGVWNFRIIMVDLTY